MKKNDKKDKAKTDRYMHTLKIKNSEWWPVFSMTTGAIDNSGCSQLGSLTTGH